MSQQQYQPYQPSSPQQPHQPYQRYQPPSPQQQYQPPSPQHRYQPYQQYQLPSLQQQYQSYQQQYQPPNPQQQYQSYQPPSQNPDPQVSLRKLFSKKTRPVATESDHGIVYCESAMTGISWNINTHPSEAKMLEGYPDELLTAQIPEPSIVMLCQVDKYNYVGLPGKKYTSPTGAFIGLDILRIIYEYYQQPFLKDELTEIINNEDIDKNTAAGINEALARGTSMQRSSLIRDAVSFVGLSLVDEAEDTDDGVSVVSVRLGI